jgi:hypothetical protein
MRELMKNNIKAHTDQMREEAQKNIEILRDFCYRDTRYGSD